MGFPKSKIENRKERRSDDVGSNFGLVSGLGLGLALSAELKGALLLTSYNISYYNTLIYLITITSISAFPTTPLLARGQLIMPSFV